MAALIDLREIAAGGEHERGRDQPGRAKAPAERAGASVQHGDFTRVLDDRLWRRGPAKRSCLAIAAIARTRRHAIPNISMIAIVFCAIRKICLLSVA